MLETIFRRVNEAARLHSKVHSRLGDAPIVVEAGAHNGSDTLRLSKLFPQGHIHAFEPVPHLFANLEERTHHLANVTRYELALSSNSAPATLHLSGGSSNASSSLLKPKHHLHFHPQVTFQNTLNVQCTSLDDWAKANGVKKVDLVWFDLQGMEFNVLKASEEIFPKIKAIYSEVSLLEMYEGCPLYRDYRRWLESKGFSVIAEDLRWSDMGNVLFAR